MTPRMLYLFEAMVLNRSVKKQDFFCCLKKLNVLFLTLSINIYVLNSDFEFYLNHHGSNFKILQISTDQVIIATSFYVTMSISKCFKI